METCIHAWELPKSCTPQPRAEPLRQLSWDKIPLSFLLLLYLWSPIFKIDKHIVLAGTLKFCNTRRASSWRSFSMSHQGLYCKNQIPIARMRPGMTWNARGKRSSWDLSDERSFQLEITLAYMEVTVDLKTAITKPLGNEKSPREHELQKSAEFSSISRCGDFRICWI